MPNWCENKLRITGKTEDIILFLESVKETYDDGTTRVFSFNKIIPEPETEAECPKQYLLKTKEDRDNAHLCLPEDKPWLNWYNFHLNEWGTKWNACGVNIEPDIETIKESKLECVDIYYQTAWSPAEGIMEYLVKHEEKYRLKFEFMFFEPGMCFLGEYSKETDYTGNYVAEYDEDTDEETYDSETQEFLNRFNNEED